MNNLIEAEEGRNRLGETGQGGKKKNQSGIGQNRSSI
jgi:hypothetical protein